MKNVDPLVFYFLLTNFYFLPTNFIFLPTNFYYKRGRYWVLSVRTEEKVEGTLGMATLNKEVRFRLKRLL